MPPICSSAVSCWVGQRMVSSMDSAISQAASSRVRWTVTTAASRIGPLPGAAGTSKDRVRVARTVSAGFSCFQTQSAPSTGQVAGPLSYGLRFTTPGPKLSGPAMTRPMRSSAAARVVGSRAGSDSGGVKVPPAPAPAPASVPPPRARRLPALRTGVVGARPARAPGEQQQDGNGQEEGSRSPPSPEPIRQIRPTLPIRF
ncbi:hypothetical protein [Streptomyces sp. CBG31]|uniref:hypothetical protein n=1 Tax=Streptomyces sp. CBG31 TaxID=2762623 RepID=UPI0037DA0E51